MENLCPSDRFGQSAAMEIFKTIVQERRKENNEWTDPNYEPDDKPDPNDKPDKDEEKDKDKTGNAGKQLGSVTPLVIPSAKSDNLIPIWT